MARSTFVYVTYIRTTPEKLWSALTDAEFMKQYWFGMHCESGWSAGAPWKLVSPAGEIFDAGEILEADPPRRLVIRWQHQNKPELAAEGAVEPEVAPRDRSGGVDRTLPERGRSGSEGVRSRVPGGVVGAERSEPHAAADHEHPILHAVPARADVPQRAKTQRDPERRV